MPFWKKSSPSKNTIKITPVPNATAPATRKSNFWMNTAIVATAGGITWLALRDDKTPAPPTPPSPPPNQFHSATSQILVYTHLGDRVATLEPNSCVIVRPNSRRNDNFVEVTVNMPEGPREVVAPYKYLVPGAPVSKAADCKVILSPAAPPVNTLWESSRTHHKSMTTLLGMAEKLRNGFGQDYHSTPGFDLEIVQTGLRVTAMIENSPAHKAGLRTGDIITHVAGRDVTRQLFEDSARVILAGAVPTVELTVKKAGDGAVQALTVAKERMTANDRYGATDAAGKVVTAAAPSWSNSPFTVTSDALNIRIAADYNARVGQVVRGKSCLTVSGGVQGDFVAVSGVTADNVTFSGFAQKNHLAEAPQTNSCRATLKPF